MLSTIEANVGVNRGDRTKGDTAPSSVMIWDGSLPVGHYTPPTETRSEGFSFHGAVREVQPGVLPAVLFQYMDLINVALEKREH